MTNDETPGNVPLSDLLGPLPETSYLGDDASYGYDACDMRDYALQAAERAVAAERERCDMLTDNMLRYAMAVIGTGSPADAARFRLFWRFAIEARHEQPNTEAEPARPAERTR